jgi:hypothetical protein
MKTIILWLERRCRKPKQVGLATAPGSVLTIFDMSRMAMEGKGRLFLVDARNVDEARKIIKQYPEVDIAEILNEQIFAIGENAITALKRTGQNIAMWDKWIDKQGKVYEHQTRALIGD